jgi:hypothetical protein
MSKAVLKKGQARAQKLYQKGLDLMSARLLALYQQTIQPVIQWTTPRLVAMRSRARASLNRMSKASKKIADRLSKPARQMVERAKASFFNAYAAVSNQWIQPIVQWVLSPLPVFQLFIQGKVREGVAHVTGKGKKLHRKVEEISSETFEFFESMVGDIAHFCSFQFITPFRRWLNKKIKQARSFKTFQEFLAYQMERALAALYRRLCGWWSAFKLALRRALQWVKEAPRRLQRGVMQAIQQAIQLTRRGINRSVYWTRWLFSFLWTLLKYGMAVVHDAATDFFEFKSK